FCRAVAQRVGRHGGTAADRGGGRIHRAISGTARLAHAGAGARMCARHCGSADAYRGRLVVAAANARGKCVAYLRVLAKSPANTKANASGCMYLRSAALTASGVNFAMAASTSPE